MANKETSEPTKDTVGDQVEETTALEGEDKIVQALFSGDINKEGLRGLIGSGKGGHSKCSTCGEEKPNHQSWLDHNCSEGHIKNLVHNKGFLSAINYFDKQYNNTFYLKCDLCGTNFRNILLYNCHKSDPEHTRRSEELLRLVHIAVGQGVVKKWDSITKPRDILICDISRYD